MDKKEGTIVGLYIANPNNSQLEKKASLIVDDKGIQTDKHYQKDPNRSILLTSTDAYQLAKEKEIQIEYGELGENILVDFDLHSLSVGDKIACGDAILEISQNCTLCAHLAKVDKRLPKLLKNDRGIFAKVVRGGTIRQNDTLKPL